MVGFLAIREISRDEAYLRMGRAIFMRAFNAFFCSEEQICLAVSEQN